MFKSPSIYPTHTACVHSVQRWYNWMASHRSVRGQCTDRGRHRKPPGDQGRQPAASLRPGWQGSWGHLLQSPLHPGGKDAVRFTLTAPLIVCAPSTSAVHKKGTRLKHINQIKSRQLKTYLYCTLLGIYEVNNIPHEYAVGSLKYHNIMSAHHSPILL